MQIAVADGGLRDEKNLMVGREESKRKGRKKRKRKRRKAKGGRGGRREEGSEGRREERKKMARGNVREEKVGGGGGEGEREAACLHVEGEAGAGQ